MVVLEGGSMLSSAGSHQYLQPDYLSPLPTTLDAKKSPLALLAQTCSQIGADSPSTKTLLSPLDKSKKSNSDSSRHSPSSGKDKNEKSSPRITPCEQKLAFKPYENNVVSKKSEEVRPSSENSDDKKSDHQSAGRKSASPSSNSSPDTGKSSPEQKSPPPRSASPIIRHGLEMLQGHPKDTPLGTYKPSLPSGINNHLSSLCCPPGLEASNPAYRPPFPGSTFSPQHAALFAAGYPGTTSPSPYLSYARVKTPSGGEALVPVCKDPYCTGCQFSLQNQQQLLMGGAAGPCPSGCTQCDHQKYNLAMAMSLVPPPSSLAYSHLGRPYVCNWIAGDNYCGKRFVTSDELLQHLRTHTNGSDPATSTSSLLNHHPLLRTVANGNDNNNASLHSLFSLHRAGYPNPPLSPLSAARYHPYSKPALSASLTASPYSAFNPTAMSPYYSAYSVYGQRLGAAAVHQ